MSARQHPNAPHNQQFARAGRPNEKRNAWYRTGNNNNKKKGKKGEE